MGFRPSGSESVGMEKDKHAALRKTATDGRKLQAEDEKGQYCEVNAEWEKNRF